MSIAGIASSIFSQLGGVQNNKQNQTQTEFQQLAQDLQAGNLTQAQNAFAALQQNAPVGQVSTSNPLSQAFSALGTDLKAGNLSAAQQDFANIQQDVANVQQAGQQGGQVHHHHHHSATQSSSTGSTQPNSIAQLFSTLGQDLQSGSLSGAQQAYSALQQDLPFLGGNISSGASPISTSILNLSA
jgi:outer membrane protein assembly factor BamD (BamD/ComL family)